MLKIIVLALLALSTPDGILDKALLSFSLVESYSVTLRSSSEDSSEEIRYYFKKPGYVRMEFIRPHRGAVLVYDPFRKKARLRPFGFLKFFVITLSPENRIIRSSNGHRIDESDIGALLERVNRLRSDGKSTFLDPELIHKKEVFVISIEGSENFTIDNIHSYKLWIDTKRFLPVKVASFDFNGKFIEEVIMDEIKINILFEDDFFNL